MESVARSYLYTDFHRTTVSRVVAQELCPEQQLITKGHVTPRNQLIQTGTPEKMLLHQMHQNMHQHYLAQPLAYLKIVFYPQIVSHKNIQQCRKVFQTVNIFPTIIRGICLLQHIGSPRKSQSQLLKSHPFQAKK